MLFSVSPATFSSPNPDKPRGIHIQRGKPEIPKSKKQIPSLSPNVPRLTNSGTSLVGDKTQTANHNKQYNSTIKGLLSLFDAEPSAFFILAFAVCNFKSCQKACARMLLSSTTRLHD